MMRYSSRLRRLVLADALVFPRSAVEPPAKPEDRSEPVRLEKVVVAEQKPGAEATFADRAAADALNEVVSGAALRSVPTIS
jgi:hypothetical protein